MFEEGGSKIDITFFLYFQVMTKETRGKIDGKMSHQQRSKSSLAFGP